MAKRTRDDILKGFLETGSEISGAFGGVVLGQLLAGQAGAFLGGITGTLIAKTFVSIGAEINERVLGPREEIRTGAVFAYALKKIKENEQNGLTVRDDTFFEYIEGHRPASEEVLEGIVLFSQRDVEEFKIKYLGNLYANICFRQDISREYANQLIKTANILSFRQFCILQLLREQYIESQEVMNLKLILGKKEIKPLDIIAEIRDLQQRGLAHIPMTHDGGDNSVPIRLDKLSITKGGLFFCEMLSLEEIERETLEKINNLTAIKG
ncbi:MAG TPA: hypothetical protein VEC12_02705 [Bacteroidia bacterium]|nr:hypothetical protein [Bacteroidia bacterium]